MLINAGTFLSNLDLLRTCVITGAKGTGKDMLASELAEYYLKKDPPYRFFSNQNHVWNDCPYTERLVTSEELEALQRAFSLQNGVVYREKVDCTWQSIAGTLWGVDVAPAVSSVKLKAEDVGELLDTYRRDEEGRVWHRVPNIRRMVIQLTEGGRYLRAWKYFENLYELSRKTDNYLLVPSIRMPHEELCEMVCENALPFATLGLPGGGVWSWQVGGQNLRKAVRGFFVHLPGPVGLYDTRDYSSRPDEIIQWFTREIEGSNVLSDAVSKVASNSQLGMAAGVDEAAAIARKLQSIALSVPHQN